MRCGLAQKNDLNNLKHRTTQKFIAKNSPPLQSFIANLKSWESSKMQEFRYDQILNKWTQADGVILLKVMILVRQRLRAIRLRESIDKSSHEPYFVVLVCS
jgi:hypothetical protein